MKSTMSRPCVLTAAIAFLTLLAGLPAAAVEDWYLYVALDGGDSAESPPGHILSFAPDGSLEWESELQNDVYDWRWVGVEFSPVTKFLYVLSFTQARAYRHDRLKGAFVDGLIGPELLTNPIALAIGPNGDVFIGNESTNEGAPQGGIQRYDGIVGTVHGKFADVGGTSGLAFGPDGKLYRTHASGQIWSHNATNGADTALYTTVSGGRIAHPLWHDGNLYVSQQTVSGFGAAFDRVVCITDGGATESNLVDHTSGSLTNPAGFAFTPDGDLLVAQWGAFMGGSSNVIKRFDGTTGAFLGDFAHLPADTQPSGVAIEVTTLVNSNDYLYFVSIDGAEEPGAATNQDKIYKFDATDTLVGTLDDHPDDDSTTEWARWSGTAIGPDGLLYVSSLGLAGVYRWNPEDGTSVDQWISSGAISQADDLAFGGPNPNDVYVACQGGPGTRQIQASPANLATGIVDATETPLTHTSVGWGPDNLVSTGRYLYVTQASPGRVHIYQAGDTNKVRDMARGNEGRPGLTGIQPYPGHLQWQDDYLYVASESNILYYTHRGYAGPPPEVVGQFLGEFAQAPAGTVIQGFDFAPNGDLLVTGHIYYGEGVGRTNWVYRFDGRTGALLNQSDPLPTHGNALTAGLAVYPLTPAGASLLGIELVTNAMIGVTFDSVAGQTYDVQLESDLVTGSWNNDPGNENIPGTGTNIVVTINPTGDAQNIRVSTDFE